MATPEVTVVEKQAPTNDPVVQQQKVIAGKGRYSHEEYLPLRFNLNRTSWFNRELSVTTTEVVWYRDAITYIEVPADFTYDLASIPRALWVVVSPWEIGLEALFHDLLYRKQEVKRRVADTTLQSMMEDRGVPWHIRWSVYLAVRMFGWRAWNKWTEYNNEVARRATPGDTAQEVAQDSALAPDKPEPSQENTDAAIERLKDTLDRREK